MKTFKLIVKMTNGNSYTLFSEDDISIYEMLEGMKDDLEESKFFTGIEDGLFVIINTKNISSVEIEEV